MWGLCTWIYSRTVTTTSESSLHEIPTRNKWKYIQWCLVLFLFLWVFSGETPVLLELRTKLLFPRKPQQTRERCGFMSLQLSCINHCVDTPSRVLALPKALPWTVSLEDEIPLLVPLPLPSPNIQNALSRCFSQEAQPVSQLLVWQITEAKILEGYSRWQTYCRWQTSEFPCE